VRERVSPSDPRKLGSPGDVTPSDPRKLGSPHFDADTALERVGDLSWRAWAPDHWFVGRGPNGGFLAAVAARAAEAAAGRPLRSLSLHFAAAPAVGPLDVAVTLEREGRTYSAASLRIEQDGRPMTLGLATLGELAEDGATWDATAMPRAKPLRDTRPVPLAEAGVWEEDGELWTPGGELIAQSRQLALVRELPE
jgi:acyl-CoA thioesterase